MTDYSDLNTNVRNYTETDTNILSDSIIAPFIKSIEDQIMRQVDLNYYRKYDTATLTVGNAFLPLPSDWQATRFVQIIDDVGGTATNDRTFLLQKDISFMNEYWPDRTDQGTPKYYAMWDQDTHYLAPTPNVAQTLELAYTHEPTGLSSSVTSTWLSQNAPNVLLYGCILQALGYLKGPADMIQYYDKMYNQSIQGLATYEMGRDRRDEYRDGVIRIPLESRNP
tara:strand:+ start:57 stop:728 length:672 start_codon:yes stop_codon:yes gene_type:complete